MIVNPAYQLYKKDEKYTGPDFWKDGVVNYPYSVTGSAQFYTPENRFDIPINGTVEFSQIPLNLYTTIKFAGRGVRTKATVSVYVGGVEVKQLTFYTSSDNFTVTIPENLRVKNQTVKLTCLSGTAIVTAATLS